MERAPDGCVSRGRCEHDVVSTKVLLIEHDTAFVAEVRRELGRLGCDVTVCDDGDVAFAHALAHRPDVILLSVELPHANGFSLCNKLKKHAELRSVPLLLMSSESTEETFEQHKKLRTHAEDYLHKPITFSRLRERLTKLVPNRALGVSSTSAAIRELPEVVAVEAEVESDRPSVEAALARAIDRASEAGRWEVVAQLARELEARRKS